VSDADYIKPSERAAMGIWRNQAIRLTYSHAVADDLAKELYDALCREQQVRTSLYPASQAALAHYDALIGGDSADE